MKAMPVVLDIDGTVCENGHRIDWQNPVSVAKLCRPYPEAQKRAAEMFRAGWEPFFLTARHDLTLSGVTYRHIVEWFGGHFASLSDVNLADFSQEGNSWPVRRDAIVAFKARELLRIGLLFGRVGVMVGDSIEDKDAADRAGWGFMWAHDWRSGAVFPGGAYAVQKPRVVVARSPEAVTAPCMEEVDSAQGVGA